jgi:hypothetical protein
VRLVRLADHVVSEARPGIADESLCRVERVGSPNVALADLAGEVLDMLAEILRKHDLPRTAHPGDAV